MVSDGVARNANISLRGSASRFFFKEKKVLCLEFALVVALLSYLTMANDELMLMRCVSHPYKPIHVILSVYSCLRAALAD